VGRYRELRLSDVFDISRLLIFKKTIFQGEIIMTPLSFEWQWNVEYAIFFGLLYLALSIIGGTLTFVGIKTALQLMGLLRERHF